MTDTELSALEAAAKAATPGPWYAYTDGSIVWEKTHEIHTAVCDSGEKNKNNAAYIAAANPNTVLSLIAELRQTRKERDWLADKLESIEWPLLTTWIEVAKEATCQKN